MTTGLLPGEIGRPALPADRPPRVAEIVASAHDLLEHEGPESLSMRRLASEVGMRAPSLYKHFSSKAAVELALVEDALLDVMFDIPERADIRKCIITEETIRRSRPPLLLTQAQLDKGVDETNYDAVIEGASA